MDELNAQEIATQLQEELLQLNRDLNIENMMLKEQLEAGSVQDGQEAIRWIMEENQKLMEDIGNMQGELSRKDIEIARWKTTAESIRGSEKKLEKRAAEITRYAIEEEKKVERLEEELSLMEARIAQSERERKDKSSRADILQGTVRKTGILLAVITVVGGIVAGISEHWEVLGGWIAFYIILILVFCGMVKLQKDLL